MTEGDQGHLSVEGRWRRGQILEELTSAMRSHHRVRRARRRAASAVCGLLLVAGATMAARDLIVVRNVVPALPPLVERPVEPPPSAPPACDIRVVRTDPAILDRYRIAARSRIVQVIDDAALLDELHRLNRPTGMMRVGNQVRLTASVVDEPRG